MLKKNPLQFSVVREDPTLELSLFKKFNVKKPILIGSAGCTSLAISCKYPDIPITLIEPNPAQIKLIKEKYNAIQTSSISQIHKKFGVGHSSYKSLIEGGNFESLFRCFRNFLFEFVLEKDQFEKLLNSGTSQEWKEIFSHSYWPVAFDLHFSNSILLAMFGPAAIQHAPAESYSRYFRQVLERGLLRKDRKNNYFLFHILLGHYSKKNSSIPQFLKKPIKEYVVKIFQRMAQNLSDYSPYDFVGLSNIFDWSSQREIKSLATKLNKELRPGTLVFYRQLNNSKNFRSYFGKDFEWLDNEAKKLHKKDLSLFYSSIHIGRKLE